MIPLWLLVVVGALGTARLTRLVTTDAIFDRPRNRIKRLGDKSTLFITCPWCTSVWLAAGVVTASALCPHQWVYVGAVLSASYVAGFLAGHE